MLKDLILNDFKVLFIEVKILFQLNGFVENILFIITKYVIEQFLLKIFLHTRKVYYITITDNIRLLGFVELANSIKVKFGFFCWVDLLVFFLVFKINSDICFKNYA